MTLCCHKGWRVAACVLDGALHTLHVTWPRLCDAHDRWITGG